MRAQAYLAGEPQRTSRSQYVPAALLAAMFLAQSGHLFEHIAKALRGEAFLGRAADNELSHFAFNVGIAVAALFLMRVRLRNPWIYPLGAVAVAHGVEHVFIFAEYLRTGASNGPGLLGSGGVVGLIPLDRLDLHNVFNGIELILITLGSWQEAETALEDVP